MATIKRLSKRYHPALLEKMIYMPTFSADEMADKSRAAEWFNELITRLNSDDTPSVRFAVNLEEDTVHGNNMARVTTISHGVGSDRTLHASFFQSGEYRSFVALSEQLTDLIGEGAYIKRGDKQKEVSSFKEALNWLMDEARRGQHIQRYKGLGEMNPDQLWETTLDSENRRLLQVKIEDAVAADEVFTTLMGDQVEPRRDFIEANALEVSNLDI
jgi:DNA gyrase subunit B